MMMVLIFNATFLDGSEKVTLVAGLVRKSISGTNGKRILLQVYVRLVLAEYW